MSKNQSSPSFWEKTKRVVRDGMDAVSSKLLGKSMRHDENKDAEHYRSKLINTQSAFGVLESYRTVRTNLLYSGAVGNGSCLGVISSLPNEGKSLSCANIAVCFSMADKKVLVIDSDMRNSSQKDIFGIESEEGLSEFLSGQTDEVLVTSLEDYPGVDVMISGKRPPNPSELMGSPRMKELLDRVRETYDVIFVDLPPVGIMSDALVVSPLINGFLLVVESGYSDSRAVKDTVDKIEQVEGKVVGTILNNVRQKGGSRYGRYGRYGKYGKYGKYGSYGEYDSYGNDSIAPLDTKETEKEETSSADVADSSEKEKKK